MEIKERINHQQLCKLVEHLASKKNTSELRDKHSTREFITLIPAWYLQKAEYVGSEPESYSENRSGTRIVRGRPKGIYEVILSNMPPVEPEREKIRVVEPSPEHMEDLRAILYPAKKQKD